MQRQWSRLILASLLFAVALVHANGPFLLTAVLPGVPAVLAPLHPSVWAMVNEPSVDASFITLTVSAFVEMGMPTTRPKMMMDDLMIMNDLVTNLGVTSFVLP